MKQASTLAHENKRQTDETLGETRDGRVVKRLEQGTTGDFADYLSEGIEMEHCIAFFRFLARRLVHELTRLLVTLGPVLLAVDLGLEL